MPNSYFDTIIIGGGMSGLECFNYLVNNRQKVLLLEAGDEWLKEHINFCYPQNIAFKLWMDPQKFDNNFFRFWKSNSFPHYSTYSGQRRVLGGRSLYWHGVILRVDKWALRPGYWDDKIIEELNSDWNGKALGLYNLLEENLKLWSNSSQESDFPLHEKHLINYFEDIGVPGFESIPRAIQKFPGHKWRAYSPVFMLDNTKIKSTKSKLLFNSLLNSISESKLGYRKIEVINNTSLIENYHAKNIILATGTIENTRIYAKNLLSSNKESFNIQDHIIQGLIIKIAKKGLKKMFQKKIHVKLLKPGNSTSRSNFFLSVQSDEKYLLIDAWEMGEQFPNDHGSKLVIEKNKTYIDFNLNSFDINLIKQQQHSLTTFVNIFFSNLGLPQPFIEFYDIRDSNGTYKKLIQSNLLAKETEGYRLYPYYCPLGTVDHEGGTMPFGKYLKINSEINHFSNIFLSGPASFPRMGAANPSLTTLSLATRLSQFILNKF